MFKFYFLLSGLILELQSFTSFFGKQISRLHGLVITEAKRGHAAQLSKGKTRTSVS